MNHQDVIDQMAQLPMLVSGSHRQVFQAVRALQQQARFLRESTSAPNGDWLFALLGEFEDTQQSDNYHIGHKRQLAAFLAQRLQEHNNQCP